MQIYTVSARNKLAQNSSMFSSTALRWLSWRAASWAQDSWISVISRMCSSISSGDKSPSDDRDLDSWMRMDQVTRWIHKGNQKTNRTLEYGPPPNQILHCPYRQVVSQTDIPPIPSIFLEEGCQSILLCPFLC